MSKPSFQSFKDASIYARRHAQEIGVTVRLERDVSGGWSVILDSEGSVADSGGNNEPPYRTYSDWLEDDRKRKKKESARREIEQQERKAKAEELEKRRPYIEEREKYYRSLSEGQLDELWNNRKNLEPDETALLRDIVREAKGIRPVYGNSFSTSVCRQCGMVGDSCTCGRSWF